MTTMHAAEVWQGGGHTGFAAERTLAEDRTSKRYAGQRAEASKKSGDGRTGFAA
ncbi:MAG: hypothetical protein KAI71_06555 [Candidatus Pacebacteria bacterium]|nr:hypothetical protein [Candidatus Paceibacterota bacterium]